MTLQTDRTGARDVRADDLDRDYLLLIDGEWVEARGESCAASACRVSLELGASRIANDTVFGLAAGVWTNDVKRADRVAGRLRAGSVWVDTGNEVRPIWG